MTATTVPTGTTAKRKLSHDDLVGLGSQACRRFALDVNHRHRRFRRNSGDVAPDKLVEHHIAYDHDAARARACKDIFGSLFIQGEQGIRAASGDSLRDCFSHQPIDCRHDAFDRNAKNALRRFKLSAEVTVTRLARKLFKNDFAGASCPGPPMISI